jgi:hypothetical protein
VGNDIATRSDSIAVHRYPEVTAPVRSCLETRQSGIPARRDLGRRKRFRITTVKGAHTEMDAVSEDLLHAGPGANTSRYDEFDECRFDGALGKEPVDVSGHCDTSVNRRGSWQRAAATS